MNTRIREVREHLGLNQEEFATKINLKRNSLSLIEVGKRNASSRTIADICREFNVNENGFVQVVVRCFIPPQVTFSICWLKNIICHMAPIC